MRWRSLVFLFTGGINRKELSLPSFLENVMVNPYSGLVSDSKFRIYESSAFSNRHLLRLKRFFFRCKWKTIDFASVIGHGPWGNYYHWYIDVVPRLWGLRDFDISEFNDLKLLIGRKLSNDERKIIRAIIPESVIIQEVDRRESFRVAQLLYLPFLSASCSGALPPDYIKFYREKVLKAFSIEKENTKQYRIFISRRQAANRKFLNQEFIESELLNAGFKVLVLEEMSLADQIYYFANACVVAGSHGAGLTNILYCTNCQVIEIFHSPSEKLNHYHDLAKACNLSYRKIELGGSEKNEDVEFPIASLVDMLQTV